MVDESEKHIEKTHSGGCQCGAVRFTVTGDVQEVSICHCRMCQKAFGSWAAALAAVSQKQLVWTRGKPHRFRSSSVADRGFCAQCGTPLFMKEDGDERIDLAVGAFDCPSNIGPPHEQIGIESAVSWASELNVLPQRNTSDTRPVEELTQIHSYQHPDHDTETWPPHDS